MKNFFQFLFLQNLNSKQLYSYAWTVQSLLIVYGLFMAAKGMAWVVGTSDVNPFETALNSLLLGLTISLSPIVEAVKIPITGLFYRHTQGNLWGLLLSAPLLLFSATVTYITLITQDKLIMTYADKTPASTMVMFGVLSVIGIMIAYMSFLKKDQETTNTQINQ
jgi:hypothetical protein